MRSARAALAAALLVIVTGCSTTAPAPAAASAAEVTATPTGPSDLAQMVCAAEAQEDIAEAVGVAAQRVETPTWQDRLYSCRYVYAGGSFAMSVKELKDALETTDHFESLRTKLGDAQDVDGLGQGGFITPNGSVVVRKDFKVLLVDDSALPATMSAPPLTPGNVAMLVAKTIMDCWTGL
jgi:hypothetical protein